MLATEQGLSCMSSKVKGNYAKVLVCLQFDKTGSYTRHSSSIALGLLGKATSQRRITDASNLERYAIFTRLTSKCGLMEQAPPTRSLERPTSRKADPVSSLTQHLWTPRRNPTCWIRQRGAMTTTRPRYGSQASYG